MGLFNWIRNKFKNKVEAPKTEPTPPIEIKPRKKLRIAIVRGHGGNDSGASGQGTNEVEYNTWCMKQIEAANIEGVKCFYGNNSIDAVTKSLPYLADLTIQLHLNSAGLTAHGCEVLVLDGDTKSYPFAEKFVADFCAKFSRRMRGDRGKKLLKSGDRGLASLKLTLFGAKILVEPWFISNPNEFVSKEDYTKFLISYIEDVQKLNGE